MALEKERELGDFLEDQIHVHTVKDSSRLGRGDGDSVNEDQEASSVGSLLNSVDSRGLQSFLHKEM